jgi:hypothetical protein
VPRQTRNRAPYTARELEQLIRWHDLARNTRSTTALSAKERKAGDLFAARIKAKKDEGFTAFLERRRLVATEHPAREAYQGVSTVAHHRTETFFPCGIHRIGIDPEYPPSRPGGLPRDALCERAKRRARYAKTKTTTTPSEDPS